jgi:hypothetical protein
VNTQSLVEDEGSDQIILSILMPCLNEAETIAGCVEIAMSFLARANISGEVLIADNGLTDDSATLATCKGARVSCGRTWLRCGAADRHYRRPGGALLS